MESVNRVRKFLTILSLLLVAAVSFASDVAQNLRLALPSLALDSTLGAQEILPVDGEIGQVVQPEATSYHSLLKQAITSEFGYEWLEMYVNSASRAAIAEVFTSFLSENLPAKNFVMSALSQNGDKSVSISVRFEQAIVDFVLMDSQIVALSVKKSL